MKQYATKGKKVPQETLGFKSKLEFLVAMWLTAHLELKAEYEPQTFKTTIGNYTPDFYLPEIKTFVEVKPNISFASLKLYNQFSKEQNRDFILITPDGTYCFEQNCLGHVNDFEIKNPEFAYCIECSKCKKVSFCCPQGNYQCRACGYHNGMHDIRHFNSTKHDFAYAYKSYYETMGGKHVRNY